MKIIPAIDLLDSKVVRLEQGKFDKVKVYSENPVLMAKKWKDMGAVILHVVDLDGARLGKPVNTEIVREIAKKTAIDIELGGGLRKEEDIENAFKAGVKFCVIGTSAVQDKELCMRIIEKFGENIIFAVDAKDGKVAVRGWEELSGKDVLEYVKELEELGAKRIIYTDISRDGMMSGPNLDTLKSILNETSLEVTASGGVSRISDIKTLKEINTREVFGVIVGKALYEGRFDLKEALSVS